MRNNIWVELILYDVPCAFRYLKPPSRCVENSFSVACYYLNVVYDLLCTVCFPIVRILSFIVNEADDIVSPWYVFICSIVQVVLSVWLIVLEFLLLRYCLMSFELSIRLHFWLGRFDGVLSNSLLVLHWNDDASNVTSRFI